MRGQGTLAYPPLVQRDERVRTIAYLGNFTVPYSTESHVAASLEALGHKVVRIQEGETRALEVPEIVRSHETDLFLWTQTYGLAVTGGDTDMRKAMLYSLERAGIPTVAYHLDLWRGLDREDQIPTEPYFRCDYFFSTDGRDDGYWANHGINHIWLPPGVYHAEAYDGTPQRQFMCDVAFVGSWRHYGHEEHWPVRKQMLSMLRKKYGRRFKTFPINRAIRGTQLTDLYASVKVVVGDSCLAGHIPGYWSDRVPETMGRGGLLVHPYVEGIDIEHPHLETYEPHNWNEMLDRVDALIKDQEAAKEIRFLQAAHTRDHHTYMNRMSTVLSTVFAKEPA